MNYFQTWNEAITTSFQNFWGQIIAFVPSLIGALIVLIIGLIEFVSSWSNPGSGISHVAHLGGMLVGFLYLRGVGLPAQWRWRYHEWRRARLRRRFEAYMRKHEGKDDRGGWIH